jgi:hypothetical protein
MHSSEDGGYGYVDKDGANVKIKSTKPIKENKHLIVLIRHNCLFNLKTWTIYYELGASLQS